MDTQPLTISRRRLLTSSLALGAGALLLRNVPSLRAEPAAGAHHLVWTWQFSDDGEPDVIGRKLLDNGLGIVVKSHDGTRWMADFDDSTYAVSGPDQIGVLSNYYENAGIPFHVWAVLKGAEPLVEARMAADALGAGARSIFLDLQAKESFWEGSSEAAVAFGDELRRLQPEGNVSLFLDPRPWRREQLPVDQLAAISNSITLQQFWRDFDTEADRESFTAAGFPPPAEGITPEFLVETGEESLAYLDLPVSHLGQGATPDASEFHRFLEATGGRPVSSWRFAEMSDDVFSLLRDLKPLATDAPAPETYTVARGDTLSSIAEEHGVSVEAIVAANGIDDPDYIYVGQELVIPSRG